jgi:hypothetical protein
MDDRLAHIERLRLRRQLELAEQQREELERQANLAPPDAFIREQCRRNVARLQAAVTGRTPSAVVARRPKHPDDDLAERRALARDEAVHTAENALTFLGRASPDDSRRCARWLVRLELELVDAMPDVPDPRPTELARVLLADEPDARPRVESTIHRLLEDLSRG